MQETLVVREARIDELGAIAEHWIAMFEEVGKHREGEFDAGWRERFVHFFADEIARGDAAYFIAADRERVVATAGARMMDGYPAAIHGIRNGYVFGVHVERAVAFLRERAPWAIRLHASPFGRPIYEKLGFTPTNEMQLHGDGKS